MPYGQNHYMGECATESAALVWIRDNKWDSAGNGTGNPKAGMAFFDTGATKLKVHDGSAWVGLGSASAAGSTGYVQFNTGGVFDAEAALFWDKSNDRLGVGCSNPSYGIEASKDGAQSVCISSFGTGVSPSVIMQRGRGSRASYSAISSGDLLGSVRFAGFYDTSSVSYASGQIQVVATENWSGSAFGAEMQFHTAPNGSAGITQRMVITQDGRFGFGVAAPATFMHLQAEASTTITAATYSSSASAALNLFRARNTVAVPQNVQLGDYLGTIAFRGYVGGGATAGQIQAVATENWSASSGTALTFWTYPNTTGALTERVRIDQSGYVGVGTTAPTWQVHASRAGDATIGSTAYGTGYRGYLLMAHANGTEGTPTTLGSYDYIGQISFLGHTGTAFRGGTAIRSMTSEAWTESNRGCQIEIFTTASTTSTVRQIATFGQDGSLTMGVVGTLGGKIVMSGLTSGTCTIQVAAAAGTVTFQLPSTNGTNGYFLRTDGAGVTSWAVATAIPAGSTTQVQYNNAGAFGADSGFTFDSTNKIIDLAGSAVNSGLRVTVAGTSAFPFLTFRRYRNTIASPQAVQSGDVIGQIAFVGYGTTGNYTGSNFVGYADATWTDSSSPAYILFRTTPAASTIPVERLRITSTGQIATGAESAPDVDPGGLCIHHGANDGYPLTFKNSDVNHPFTAICEADTYLRTNKTDSAAGGANFIGFGTGSVGIGLLLGGANSNPVSGTSDGCVAIVAYKSNGTTGFAALAATENLAAFRSYQTTQVIIKGSGDIHTVAGLKIGAYGQTAAAGAIEWNGTNFRGYTGSVWKNLDASGGTTVDAGTAQGQVLFWNNAGSAWTYAETSEWIWDDTNKRVGINEAAPSSRLDVGGDVEIASNGWHYYGDPSTDGSWRTGRVSADLVVQKRESGTWNTKHTFS